MVSKKRKEKMSWSESLLYKYSKTYRQIWKNKETLEDIKAQNIQTQVMLQALAEKSDKIPETGLSVSEFVSFLNYTVDITKLPPAKGKMRALRWPTRKFCGYLMRFAGSTIYNIGWISARFWGLFVIRALFPGMMIWTLPCHARVTTAFLTFWKKNLKGRNSIFTENMALL